MNAKQTKTWKTEGSEDLTCAGNDGTAAAMMAACAHEGKAILVQLGLAWLSYAMMIRNLWQ